MYAPSILNGGCLATVGDNPTTSWLVCGAKEIGISRTMTFKVILTAPAGFTAEARLFDKDAGPPAAVAGSTVSTTATSPTPLSASVTLIAGHVYYVQIRIAAGSPTALDIAHLDNAEIV